jgi:predicted nucleotidyltransferase
MDLTARQKWIIQDWAKRTPHVYEVRLFGSRARGPAPDSDIDLALTVARDSNPGTVQGIYFALGKGWQDQLTRLLEVETHVALYNDPDPSPVPIACDTCSIVLFP